MLRRSILTIALATVLFSLGLFMAGSPAATAATLGLLIFLALVTVVVGWENLKAAIVEEVEQTHRQVIPTFPQQERVEGHECRSWSLGQPEPVVGFQAAALADNDPMPAGLARSFHLSRQLPYDAV